MAGPGLEPETSALESDALSTALRGPAAGVLKRHFIFIQVEATMKGFYDTYSHLVDDEHWERVCLLAVIMSATLLI